MKCCEKHWTMMREAIERHGLGGLVAPDDAPVLVEGEEPEFCPLTAMNCHYFATALARGGLSLMTRNADGSNDGHYCPVCVFEKNGPLFVATDDIETTVLQIVDNCRAKGLIPAVQ
jgi:hypothetical protein